MEGYLIWLVFLVLIILFLSLYQLQAGRYRESQSNCRQLQIEVQRWQDKHRERERDIDRLKRDFAQLLKWKDRAAELEMELKAMKQTKDYTSGKRLHYLEEYITSLGCASSAEFLGTLPSRSLHTFEDKLSRMLEGAEFEVVILSPWIKKQMWDRVRGQLKKFIQRGGNLRVFMRGCESDYSSGMSDDIQDAVKSIGGEVLFVHSLHAKIYVIDRREAIVTSANLSKGGIDDNYEAGIWLNDPNVLKDICAYIDDLRRCRQP
jgi:hypothetical protein